MISSSNRILLGNLALRLALVTVVLATGHWLGGDSHYYLSEAQKVCQGGWGGEPTRVPLYLWYLCVTSRQIGPNASTWQVAFPIIFQTLLVWITGVWLYKKMPPSPISPISPILSPLTVWLFDPVLLVYSGLIHSDALFAVALFFLCVQLKRVFEGDSSKITIFLTALGLSLVALTRNVGIPIVMLTFVFLLIKSFKKPSVILAIMVLVLLFLSPRIFWSASRFHFLGLASQGSAWVENLAGALEYYGSGSDFIDSEHRWYKEQKDHSTSFALKRIASHWKTWVWLTTKGLARVFFGHVNVEWAYFFTGRSPVGPGWFKVPENRAGPELQGVSLLLWVLGLLAMFLYCLCVYKNVWKSVKKKKIDTWTVWSLLVILLFALMPQIFGDARFRIPIWPVIILIWFYKDSEPRKKLNHDATSVF